MRRLLLFIHFGSSDTWTVDMEVLTHSLTINWVSFPSSKLAPLSYFIHLPSFRAFIWTCLAAVENVGAEPAAVVATTVEGNPFSSFPFFKHFSALWLVFYCWLVFVALLAELHGISMVIFVKIFQWLDSNIFLWLWWLSEFLLWGNFFCSPRNLEP